MTTRTHQHQGILRDPVGTNEIAERLDVAAATVHSWRSRGKHLTKKAPLPDPATILTNTPLWEWATVEAWARETGRLAAKEETAS
jgi:uncharacterized protein YjcR